MIHQSIYCKDPLQCIFPLIADYEMDEETSDENEKTEDEQVVKRPQGISLFMFVLIALTGAVLFVLNITGVLCYLRRRSFFQGLSGKFFYQLFLETTGLSFCI